ncbi:hypothetical protein [Streptomyces sp. NPDC093089]|uniref:hypothetical protein n=1 Tax=Streptomyces sp. NPDC093089 TaxID=3366024 RepID=UPI0037FEA32B
MAVPIGTATGGTGCQSPGTGYEGFLGFPGSRSFPFTDFCAESGVLGGVHTFPRWSPSSALVDGTPGNVTVMEIAPMAETHLSLRLRDPPSGVCIRQARTSISPSALTETQSHTHATAGGDRSVAAIMVVEQLARPDPARRMI